MGKENKVEILVKLKDQLTKELRNINKELKVAKGEAEKTGKSFSDMSSSFKKAAIGLGVVSAGLGILAKSFLTEAAGIEQTRIAFETLAGDADTAKNKLKELSDFAVKTPFQIEEVEQNAFLLTAMGVEMDNLIPTMRMLGDVSRGQSDVFKGLALNYGQVLTQGKLTGRELRDFAVRGIPLLGILSESLNKTKGEITDMISAGEITSELVTAAFKSMSDEGGKFFGFMDKQSETFNGIMSNVKDSVTRLKREMGESLLPVGKRVGDMLKNLTELFRSLSPEVKAAISATIAITSVLTGFLSTGFLIISFLPQFAAGIRVIQSGFILLKKTFVTQLAIMEVKLLSSPVGLILTGGAGALAFGVKAVTEFEDFADAVSGIFGRIKAGTLLDDLSDTTNAVKDFTREIGFLGKQTDEVADEVEGLADEVEGLGVATPSVPIDFSKLLGETGGDISKATSTAEKERKKAEAERKKAEEEAKEEEKKRIAEVAEQMKILFTGIKESKEEYEELAKKGNEALTKLERDHEQKLSSINDDIETTKKKLKELEESFDIQIKGFDVKAAEEVVAQEEKIADIRKKIIEAQKELTRGPHQTFEQFEELGLLQTELKKQEEALMGAADLRKGLVAEIAEAERKAGLTEFERAIEDVQAKKEAAQVEFDEKKVRVEEEIALLKEKRDEENLIFAEQRDEFKKTADEFNKFKDQFVQGLNVMSVNASEKVDLINRKIAEMRSAFEGIGATPSLQVFGAEPGITPETTGGTVVAGGTTNEININLNGVSVRGQEDIDAIQSSVEAALSRSIKLNSLGSQ